MAVTLNYVWPATGAVAPVAGQVFDSMIVDITASADADTTATIPHLMGAAPAEVYLTDLLQASAGLSLWAAAPGAANVVLTKSTATGSGNAGAQVRCIIKRPHTIGR